MTTAATTEVTSTAWRTPYIRYVIGRGISTAGTSLVNVVLAFAVLRTGGDGFSVGLVLGCSVTAQTLLLPLGGVLADRLSRRTLVIAGNALLALVQGLMGAVLLGGRPDPALWMFLLAAAATGATAAAVQPAFQGLIVQLVPPQALQGANAALRLVLNIARIAVPGVGSLLGAAFGFGPVLLTAAAAFAVCALVLAGLHAGESGASGRTAGFYAGAREGWAAFRSRPWMWGYALSGTVAVPLWMAGYQLLGPLVLSGRPEGAQHWGWAVSAFSAGMVLGSLIALQWKPRRVMLACVLVQLVWPLPLAALAYGADLVTLLAAMLISGASLELAVVFFETAKQQHVPEALIGRVTSLTMLGETALVPVAYVLAGTLADSAGSTTMMWVCCLGILAATVVLLAVPDVRGLTSLSARGTKRG
ncbi:MFS transporter (plasmid) [Streptomyces xanthophaeus]|uniref:MFS transporter n=1 Tax=Streptomyces xanthophaeus TaxID=67385 RepID=UPI00398F9EFE